MRPSQTCLARTHPGEAGAAPIPLPLEVASALTEFLSERRTGNIQLNIKDGKILGAHITEIINCKTNRPRIVGNRKVRSS